MAVLEIPVTVDKHFSPSFYAELIGVDASTVTRWFRDEPGVLLMGDEKPQSGRRTRTELRIPYSVFLRVYGRRTKGAAE